MITPAVQIVLDWHAALNEQDVERLVSLSAEDVEVGGPRGMANGAELLRDWVARAHVRLEPIRWHARYDTVVVAELARWETPDGQLTDAQEVASVFQVMRGRVSSVVRYSDLASALTAAGLSDQLS